MQKYRKRIGVALGVALAIYIILLVYMDNSGRFGAGVGSALGEFPIWLLPILGLTQVSAGFFRYLEWRYYLGVIDVREQLSELDSIIIFVSSFTMVVSPGKVAEVLKSVFLKLKTGAPIAVSAPIVVAERVVDGLAVVVTLTITLLVAGDSLQLGAYRDISAGIIFTSAAILIGGLIVVQIKPLAYFVLSFIRKVPVVWRYEKALTDFYESSREIFRLRHVIPTSLMGIGVYLSSTTGFVLILWGFGVNVTADLWVEAAFIVGVASAIGALSFVPNGAGVTEVSNAAMLSVIVAPANPELTAATIGAAALLQGFYHKWFRVIVGMIVAIIFRRRLFTPALEAELAAMDAQEPTLSADVVSVSSTE